MDTAPPKGQTEHNNKWNIILIVYSILSTITTITGFSMKSIRKEYGIYWIFLFLIFISPVCFLVLGRIMLLKHSRGIDPKEQARLKQLELLRLSAEDKKRITDSVGFRAYQDDTIEGIHWTWKWADDAAEPKIDLIEELESRCPTCNRLMPPTDRIVRESPTYEERPMFGRIRAGERIIRAPKHHTDFICNEHGTIKTFYEYKDSIILNIKTHIESAARKIRSLNL